MENFNKNIFLASFLICSEYIYCHKVGKLPFLMSEKRKKHFCQKTATQK